MAKKNVNPKIQHKGGSKPAPQAKDIRAGRAKHRTQKAPAAPNWMDAITRKPWLPWALMGFLLVLVSLLYFPVAFGGKTPQASDISQWQGAANKIIEYNQDHTDRALWTQSMFSGMPSYLISFPNRFPFLENISRLTDKLINWRIFLLFIGALGMFLLLRFLRLDVWTSFFGAVAFMFSCHWLGLLEIGHNTKFRAIMYIPWVVWAFMRLRRKPGLLGLGFLATALIVQLRENHPQISYYLYLFLGLYWVWQLIESIRAKDHKRFWLFTFLMVLAFGLTVLAVMNPYLSTMEYSRFTMRGGSAGLETSYAQGWSFHPKEIITFFIPDFYGGISPNYWGYMPFTQTYNYFGLIVLAFGIIALIGKKYRRCAVFLAISSLIFLIMSFGSATPWLSGLFLKYLPYFNKFRVPSMILTMVQFNAVLLAALGVSTILHLDEERKQAWSKGLLKAFWICGGVLLLWLILAKTLFGGLGFASASDLQQITQQGLAGLPETVKAERLGVLYNSGAISLLLLSLSLGLAWLKSVKKLPQMAFVLLLTLLVFIDLFIYTGKFLKAENLQARQEYVDRFAPRDYDEFLLADKGNFRVLPVGQSMLSSARMPRPSGEWAYHHQSITGYSAAKLKRYDEILKLIEGDGQKPGEWGRLMMGMYGMRESQLPVDKPTPVLDMLATKYIIHPDPLPNDSLFTLNYPPFDQVYNKLTPVFRGYDGTTVYANETALPRAWFVDEVQKVAPADSILPKLRAEDFDPRRLAYVETDLEAVQQPDSARVSQTVAEMHKLAYDVYTDKPAFLVLSEVYYPAGWKASLDGKEIPIHAANYILRGLRIPAGEHKLELVFAPDSYKTSVGLSLIGLLISLLALGGGLVFHYLKQRPAPAPEQTQTDDR
ncbi:MAG: YfhO family protein [Candidatus Cloacimonetes bacterium]|nr:YfhO family protein [Candidatus Cloacimonadota bacterium]